MAYSPNNLNAIAGLLRVLGEPKRLLILDLLMQGERCNCEMGDALDLAPNLISHHLSSLREAGLVNVRRDSQDARWIYYSINRTALEDVGAALAAFLDPARIQIKSASCDPQRGPECCATPASSVER